MNKVLFWFRNDLRLHDNEALVRAAELGEVVPVYVIDERQFAKTNLGFKRSDKFRAKFLLESVANLQENLKLIGSNLIVKKGISEDVILELVKEFGITHVLASKEQTQEETSIESAISYRLKPLNIEIELFWGNTLIHVRDLPFQIHFLPDIFTDFRKKVENYWKVRPLFDTPTSLPGLGNQTEYEIPTLKEIGFGSFERDNRDENKFKGGEDSALARLHEYFWEGDHLKNYKETRNGMLGANYSSKLSPWLAVGAISPRKIYFEVKKYEAERVSNNSTYWLIFELLWRDYFHFIALKFGVRLFKRCGIKHDFSKKWKRNKEQFKLWINGKTGVPIVDACMIELKSTGYLSNRGRQIAASFFVNDLGIEWWWGAMYFESQLIDYEVCSNWGNWNYLAGIGTDPRENRYFNPIKQAEKYDAEAKFIKYWIPALQEIDSILLVNFLELSSSTHESLAYPTQPIVLNKKWQK